MLVVVGSRHDPGAREIVKQWENAGAALLSCEDLSSPGWRYCPTDRRASRAVIGARVVPDTDIRGVLVRRPQILQQELPYIAAADREFVATEMTAFLLAWLSHLPCRVLNRPRGTSLCGPDWRPEQWTHAASMIGIPVEPVQRHVPAAAANINDPALNEGDQVEAVVVGGRCLGDVSMDQAAAARKLAVATGVDLLTVRFAVRDGESRFVTASAMSSLADAHVAEAVREYLSSA